MMRLSDSGGLAEGDFDYELYSSFSFKVEENCKTLCLMQILQRIF